MDYFGHIFRNNNYGFEQLIVVAKIEGRRGIECQRFSWLRDLREWFHIRQACTLIGLAQDREYLLIRQPPMMKSHFGNRRIEA